MAEPFYIPISNTWQLLFIHILANAYCFPHDYSHPSEDRVIQHCGFNLTSLTSNDVEPIFMCLLAIPMYFSGEMCIQIFSPFVSWVVSLLMSYKSTLHGILKTISHWLFSRDY